MREMDNGGAVGMSGMSRTKGCGRIGDASDGFCGKLPGTATAAAACEWVCALCCHDDGKCQRGLSIPHNNRILVHFLFFRFHVESAATSCELAAEVKRGFSTVGDTSCRAIACVNMDAAGIITTAIRLGVPMFNSGDAAGCAAGEIISNT